MEGRGSAVDHIHRDYSNTQPIGDCMNLQTLLELSVLCEQLKALTTKVRQETIDIVAKNDHVAVIKHYDKVRELTENIKESREALNALEKQLSYEYVPDVMRANGIKTTTIDGVGRVSLSTRWSASIEDKQIGYEWLRANGHGGVIV